MGFRGRQEAEYIHFGSGESYQEGAETVVVGQVNHGRRLSGTEYDRMVAELYLGLPDDPSINAEQRVLRREFDLRIDHRLGINFPQNRREELWRVNERINRRPIRMIFAWQVARVLPNYLAGVAKRLASSVIEEYSAVLTPEELRLFFGEEEAESPGLPVNRR